MYEKTVVLILCAASTYLLMDSGKFLFGLIALIITLVHASFMVGKSYFQ